MKLAEAYNTIVRICPTVDGKTRVELIKALRAAWEAGKNAGRASLDSEVEYRRGYAQAMKDAEAEFQQRAVDYVAGCLRTADELRKRVA